jgi:uncharacterized RDD family membrane protein YckC
MSQYNPYQAPSAHVDDVSEEMELAGRGTRLAAAIIDGLIMMVLFIALGTFMAPGMFHGEQPSFVQMLPLWSLVMAIWFGANYPLLSKRGQTIGKKVMSIRIVRVDGTDCAAGRIIGLRYLAPGLIGQIPLLGPIFGLVDALFIFQESRRCIHDLIADTIVVRA